MHGGACGVRAVLGAAESADDITWWENTAGDGTAWVEHTVDAEFDGAWSVFATDVDGDGDVDVLGGASQADDIAWWENTTGDGTTWIEHTVDSDFDARSVFATDLDGDGDVDVLGGAHAHDIAWWENRGGQFALPTMSLAPANVAPPSQAAALDVDIVHNGRPARSAMETADADVELVTIELLLDDGVTPLTDAQANSAIDMLHFYRDDGSGEFDDADFQVASVGPLSLTAGVQTLSFVDGDANVQVGVGGTSHYFVVIDFKTGATFNPLRVTHLTESSSTAEDRDHDIPLKLEFLANVSTPNMVILGGPGLGAGCPADVVLADQTLSGTQTIQATTSVTLGEDLDIDGTDIAVKAPTVSILNDTGIGGTFRIGSTPSCP